jgi:hypothetical protein
MAESESPLQFLERVAHDAKLPAEMRWQAQQALDEVTATAVVVVKQSEVEAEVTESHTVGLGRKRLPVQ